MKYKDWSDWKIACSCISEIMVRPKGAVPITTREQRRLSSLAEAKELADSDIEFMERMRLKDERFRDPELSTTAIKHLLRRYSWEKYNKRVASIDAAHSAAKKGNLLEEEAIEVISSIDKAKYRKEQGTLSNDFLLGVCDVFHADNRKIIDVKASWNIYTWMPNHITPVDIGYWFQMQGYMELYDADVAQVCYVLVNTPHHLVIREREKLSDRFLMGEISKEKFEDGMMGLSHAFDYNKIPIKRRVIRQTIHRHREIIPVIYSKVIKCREWLNEFERIHINNKEIIVEPERYVKYQKEDNPESDSADSR